MAIEVNSWDFCELAHNWVWCDGLFDRDLVSLINIVSRLACVCCVDDASVFGNFAVDGLALTMPSGRNTRAFPPNGRYDKVLKFARAGWLQAAYAGRNRGEAHVSTPRVERASH
jgi:hypothetical protein